VNSKVVLLFVVAALVGIAFYVVRAKDRKRHASSSFVATDPPPSAKSADPPPPRPRN